MTQLAHLDTVIEGLHASHPEPLPFAPSLHVRAFLLERDRGNLLVYNVPGLDSDAASIEQLGGISRHYLNHWHEAMVAPPSPEAPLFVHERDRAPVEQRAHVRATFSRRHLLDDDFEVIPTPGHTPGATAFLWDTGRRRLLFTGDTISLDDGRWTAAVLESSDRERYIESLELIRGLDFDVLVPWVATAGRPYHAATTPEDTSRNIDAMLERLRRGETH
jgi:hypothetical protein